MSSLFLLPPYPSSEELGFACWLRQLAAQLPACAARYDVCPAQVQALGLMATAVVTTLANRVAAASQARAGLTATLADPTPRPLLRPVPAPTPPLPNLVSPLMLRLVRHLLHHPAYAATSCPLPLSTLPPLLARQLGEDASDKPQPKRMRGPGKANHPFRGQWGVAR